MYIVYNVLEKKENYFYLYVVLKCYMFAGLNDVDILNTSTSLLELPSTIDASTCNMYVLTPKSKLIFIFKFNKSISFVIFYC